MYGAQRQVVYNNEEKMEDGGGGEWKMNGEWKEKRWKVEGGRWKRGCVRDKVLLEYGIWRYGIVLFWGRCSLACRANTLIPPSSERNSPLRTPKTFSSRPLITIKYNIIL